MLLIIAIVTTVSSILLTIFSVILLKDLQHHAMRADDYSVVIKQYRLLLHTLRREIDGETRQDLARTAQFHYRLPENVCSDLISDL